MGSGFSPTVVSRHVVGGNATLCLLQFYTSLRLTILIFLKYQQKHAVYTYKKFTPIVSIWRGGLADAETGAHTMLLRGQRNPVFKVKRGL